MSQTFAKTLRLWSGRAGGLLGALVLLQAVTYAVHLELFLPS